MEDKISMKLLSRMQKNAGRDVRVRLKIQKQPNFGQANAQNIGLGLFIASLGGTAVFRKAGRQVVARIPSKDGVVALAQRPEVMTIQAYTGFVI